MRNLLALLFAALPSLAFAFEPVVDRDRFLALTQGRSLNIALYSLSLTIDPQGSIQGRALGSAVTGSWQWKDGYFCRKILWSSVEIPHNCQLVEEAAGKLRFTSDRGQGRSAAFVLK